MDPADAVEVSRAVEANVLVPIHWGTLYPRYLGRTMRATWADTERVLAEYVRRRAPELELRLLRPGQTTRFRAATMHRERR
jgi:L-ascorbate metabolism protein UlaG (beta-lactamase superfamily)